MWAYIMVHPTPKVLSIGYYIYTIYIVGRIPEHFKEWSTPTSNKDVEKHKKEGVNKKDGDNSDNSLHVTYHLFCPNWLIHD